MKTLLEIEKAKKLLEENGYQVENLWQVKDVQSKYNCTDDEAHKVLINALQNNATMEQIWYAIDFHAEEIGLTKK
tara:strand:- start:630 stop:854 length:225 start_codon:yes stop_codon:yes gene_type:complete